MGDTGMDGCSNPGSKPVNLLKKLVLIASVSLIVILAAASFGIYKVYYHYVIDGAEHDSINIGKALFQQEKNTLLSRTPEGNFQISVPQKDFAPLDQRLRPFLHPFNIVKIKIYSLDKTIVYSTDHKIVGKIDKGNPRLERALSGQNDSKMVLKKEVRDLAAEKKFDVDVVETYTPIIAENGSVIGSFEVYIDVTRYRKVIWKGVATSSAILASILVFVFGCSFRFIRKSTDQVNEAHSRLEKMATIDALTGIFNRGHILTRAAEEFSRITRIRSRVPQNLSLGFIMIDIDNFKKINDTYGHLAGDAVLHELSDRIRTTVRNYDLVGRYGGEEFLVIISGSGLEDTAMLAERLRLAIADIPFNVEGTALPVTISLGVSCTHDFESDYTLALKRADDALYHAKRNGKNMVARIGSET